MKRTTLPLLVLIGLAVTVTASPDAFRSMRLALAEVGIGATVPVTPINTRVQELDQRERELNAREQAVRNDEERTALWLALSVVAGLVAANFILDWRRNRV